MPPERHLLCVVYHFPPAGGAGVQRPVKFIKYLRQHGWRAHVLTVRDGCYFAHDPTLAADLPATTQVRRTPSWEVERLAPLRRARQAHSEPGGAIHAGLGGRVRRLLAQARAYVVPDPQIGWLPFAVPAGLAWCRQQRMDAIWSTSPPATAHLVARAIAQRTGLPWLCDFRDAWSQDIASLLRLHPLHRVVEAGVLRHAARVVGVTQPIVDHLLARDPGAAASKYHVIANGFDPDDFAGVVEPAARHPWQIAFAGSVYGKTSLVPFLQGLAQFRAQQPEAAGKIRFSLVGQMDLRAGADFAAAVAAHGLDDCCERRGYVSHAESIAHIRRAHLLLLPLYGGPAARGAMSGKIFEYLAARRPILALADRGVAADLIDEAGAGLVVPPDDPVAMAAALGTLWHAHVKGAAAEGGDPAVVNRYSRATQAAALAEILAAMTTPRGAAASR